MNIIICIPYAYKVILQNIAMKKLVHNDLTLYHQKLDMEKKDFLKKQFWRLLKASNIKEEGNMSSLSNENA